MMYSIIFSLIMYVFLPLKPGIVIENTWMREGMKGMNSAAYCLIKNNSTKDDQLLSVTCKSAKIVQIHETFRDGDNMGMRKAGDIIIKANSSFEMKPGGFHVMLIKLTEDIKKGSRKELVFKFKNSGIVKVLADIKKDG